MLATVFLATAGCLSIANPQYDGPPTATSGVMTSASDSPTAGAETTDGGTSTTNSVVGSGGGSSSGATSVAIDSTGEASTTSGGSTESSGGTTGGLLSNCCEIGPQIGCDDLEVANCVCNVAPNCCAFGWTEDCVATVEAGCGSCPHVQFDCECQQFCFSSGVQTFEDTLCAPSISVAVQQTSSACTAILPDKCTCSKCECSPTGVAGTCD